MLAEKEIELEVSECAMIAIALEGYDPTYGARPLKRVIQQSLQNPLAVELLKHESVAGADGSTTWTANSPSTVPQQPRRNSLECGNLLPLQICYH